MKSILIIVPFDPIYPPMNGGMQRCFHILHQLALHFDLTAVIHQDKVDFLKSVKHYPAIASAKILSTKNIIAKDLLSLVPAKFENALRSRWYQRVLNTPADSSLIKYYPVLIKLLKRQKFDAIILENLATLNAVKIIRRYDKGVKIIYDAHNVDSNLAKAAFERREITEIELKRYQIGESNLYKKVDAVIACSENDKNTLEQMNDKKLPVAVVPNGVDIPSKIFNQGVHCDPEYILFCGSLWSIPNAEGLYWFCKKIWPLISKQMPTLKLLVVGIGELPSKFAEIKDAPNMELVGAVEDVKPWYQKSAVSVVPLLSGSGTRLKILEAMSLGVPVISTSKGAEGIDYIDSENIVIADQANNFAEALINLLEIKKKRVAIQESARYLVEEKYDWNIIGERMAEFFENKLPNGK